MNNMSSLAIVEPQPLSFRPYVPNMNEIGSISAMCKVVARSTLLNSPSKNLADREADAFYIAAWGMEMGIPMMTSLRMIYIIEDMNGKKSLGCSAQLLLGMMRRAGVKVTIPDPGTVRDSVTVTIQRPGGEPRTFTYSLDMASKAGLLTKRNWKNHPAEMQIWRAVSTGGHMECPDIVGNMYLVEELNPDIQVDTDGNVIPGTAGAFKNAMDETQSEIEDAASEGVLVEPEPLNLEGEPKGSWADTDKLESMFVTLAKNGIEKADISTLLPDIKDPDDIRYWNHYFAKGVEAAQAVADARDKRKAALGSQSAQPPVYGKPSSAPAGFSADDLTAIRQACSAWFDPEMEMALLPDVAAAAVGSLPFDWSTQFKTVKDAIQAITGYAQRRNLPMIVSRACYRQSGGNSYTALSNGQLTVRMYGRDRLRNLGTDWPAIVDAGAIDQPYNLPQTIVVTWEDKGDYSLAREVRLLGTPVAKAALADTSHVGSLTSAGVAQELAAADANDAVDPSKIPF